MSGCVCPCITRHDIGHSGSYRGHTTWDPRRHMYEELGSCPRGRLPPPPCHGSDETMYHRSGKNNSKV